MTSALDQRAQSQQFVIAQQANLPMQPFRPDPDAAVSRRSADWAACRISFAHLWWN